MHAWAIQQLESNGRILGKIEGGGGGGGGLLVRVVAQWQSTAAGMYVGLMAAPPFLHSPLPAI